MSWLGIFKLFSFTHILDAAWCQKKCWAKSVEWSIVTPIIHSILIYYDPFTRNIYIFFISSIPINFILFFMFYLYLDKIRIVSVTLGCKELLDNNNCFYTRACHGRRNHWVVAIKPSDYYWIAIVLYLLYKRSLYK